MKKLPKPIKFEWDKGNVDKNWKKHKVHYREAEEVFFNKPLKLFPDSKHSTKEEKRYLALGQTDSGKPLTVIFTVRDKRIRIISARKQHKKERSTYEK